MKISKVLASNGDGITVEASTNVWIDHCELSSDLDHGKDYYDGLVDITHGSDWVTVSNSYLHDHVGDPWHSAWPVLIYRNI
jgi:pectate lyase